MTVTRLVIVLVAGFLFADYEIGNGRLVDLISYRVVETGRSLDDALSILVRRISR
jgi:hypothetical protein